jgi:hydrogenase expression/formation protein HypC
MCLAIPGKMVEISSDNQDCALVDVAGVRRKIEPGLLPDDKPVAGDWVPIHVGFAMSKISEQDAADQSIVPTAVRATSSCWLCLATGLTVMMVEAV